MKIWSQTRDKVVVISGGFTEETCDNIVISARDTDILFPLLMHYTKIGGSIWMLAGTSSKMSAVMPFHALNGSDTTYLFSP